MVEFRYPVERSDPVVSVVLLAAFPGSDRPHYTLKSKSDSGRGSIHHLELGLPDGPIDHIAWSTDLALPIGDGKPFTTDGTLVWCRVDQTGQITCHFVLGGTYLRNGTSTVF